MQRPLSLPSGQMEVRGVIRFLTAQNCEPTNIHEQITNVYGNVMSIQSVRKWVRLFRGGREDIRDLPRSGRPSDATNEDTVAGVRMLLDEDRRMTVRQMTQALRDRFIIEVSTFTVLQIIHDMGLKKVCARWVPRDLTEDHRTNRSGAALEFLTRYHRDPTILNRIVTGDESWVHHFVPSSKQDSMVWKKAEEPAPKKFKTVASAGKVMVTVFWDHLGPIHVEFMEKGSTRTITSNTYCETLKRLRKAIKDRRPGLLSSGVILIHDNARPHSANQTKQLLQSFKWDIFPHPPYSPDLAPSDYHLFPALKRSQGSKKFKTDEEVKNFVVQYFKGLDAQFYRSGIEKLVYRYNKCLDLNGDYVEK